MAQKTFAQTEDFIGTEVNLFPSDTRKKKAILLYVDDVGYAFQITYCEDGSKYKIGDVVFFNHSSQVIFSI